MDEGVPLGFPMWVLVRTAALQEEGLPAAAVALGGADFGHFVPLFTSLDAARGFLAAASLLGVSPLALGTPPVLGAVLDDFYRRGVQSCGIDLHYLPGEHSPTGRFFPSRSLIEAIFGKQG